MARVKHETTDPVSNRSDITPTVYNYVPRAQMKGNDAVCYRNSGWIGYALSRIRHGLCRCNYIKFLNPFLANISFVLHDMFQNKILMGSAGWPYSTACAPSQALVWGVRGQESTRRVTASGKGGHDECHPCVLSFSALLLYGSCCHQCWHQQRQVLFVPKLDSYLFSG